MRKNLALVVLAATWISAAVYTAMEIGVLPRMIVSDPEGAFWIASLIASAAMTASLAANIDDYL